jgi:hypothetical protein
MGTVGLSSAAASRRLRGVGKSRSRRADARDDRDCTSRRRYGCSAHLAYSANRAPPSIAARSLSPDRTKTLGANLGVNQAGPPQREVNVRLQSQATGAKDGEGNCPPVGGVSADAGTNRPEVTFHVPLVRSMIPAAPRPFALPA